MSTQYKAMKDLEVGDKTFVEIFAEENCNAIHYTSTRTAENTWHIQTNSLISSLAGMDHLVKNGWQVKLDPRGTEWPSKYYAGANFYVERATEGTVVLKTVDKKEETSEEDTVAAAVSEPAEEGVVEGVSLTDTSGMDDDALSSDELLDGPNWNKAKTMTKQGMEDYADKFNIQIDPTKSKSVMLDAFKAEWAEKVEGVA